MPTTDRDAQALTYLACRIRKETYGACDWDEAGTHAVIAKLVGQNLPSVVERVTRHAGDPEAKTPGAINRPFVPAAQVGGPPRPLKPHEACQSCGRPLHAPDDVCTGRVLVAPIAPHIETVRHLVDVTKRGLCPHGVAPELCIDHRKTSQTEPASTEGA